MTQYQQTHIQERQTERIKFSDIANRTSLKVSPAHTITTATRNEVLSTVLLGIHPTMG